LDKGSLTSQKEKILEHLPLLADRRWDRLLKKANVTAEALRIFLKEMRTLVPHPGFAFQHEVLPLVIPDVIMTGDSQKGWSLTLNEATLPKLLLAKDYLGFVSGKVSDQEARKYVSAQYTQGRHLLQAMDHRARTIIRVGECIVSHQRDFFIKGVCGLTPMTLKDVAQELEVHESTVSRVSSKYIQTPRGTFCLKYFFSSGLAHNENELDTSSEAVRARIQELIGNEDHNTPLSDDGIVTLLTAEGVQVARRTVVKYRKALNIGSSFERKRTYAHPSWE
jgi:RNA polymerase sigma-54 factor